MEEKSRNLDTLSAASMDYRALAALLDSMKKLVETAKKNVLNKLVRKIKLFKKKRDASTDAGIKNKTDRLLSDIAVIKEFESSRVCKFALANENTTDDLSKKGHVSQHLVCLTRLAEDKSLKTFVEKWRAEHEDWRILANFLLSKNTSRHFKRSEKKKKVTKNSLLVEKELLKQRLDGAEVEQTRNVNDPIIPRTKKGQQGTVKATEKSKTVSSEDDSGSEEDAEEEGGDSDTQSEITAADDPSDDDLYTFNIVENDLKGLEETKNEGQQVTVSVEDKQKPTDVKTSSLASRLFTGLSTTAEDEMSSDGSSQSDDEESSSQPKTVLRETTPTTESLTSKILIEGKTKKKKLPSHKELISATKNPNLPSNMKLNKPVSSGEMVKAVLNIDELLNDGHKSELPLTDSSVFSKPVTRRKKSAFFMGGEDEIDESLGVSKQAQDRAYKNKKSTYLGYKGVKNSEKKWLKSSFTGALNAEVPKEKTKGKHPHQKPGKPSSSDNWTGGKDSAHSTENKYSNKKSANGKLLKSFKSEKKEAKEESMESLHPSWQASKKRKEQLELVKSGPQNKKIKFDDD